MGRGGIEPPTPGFSVGLSTVVETAISPDGDTRCDVASNQSKTVAQQKEQHEVRNPDDLARLTALWSLLPRDVQQAIMGVAEDAVIQVG